MEKIGRAFTVLGIIGILFLLSLSIPALGGFVNERDPNLLAENTVGALTALGVFVSVVSSHRSLVDAVQRPCYIQASMGCRDNDWLLFWRMGILARPCIKERTAERLITTVKVRRPDRDPFDRASSLAAAVLFLAAAVLLFERQLALRLARASGGAARRCSRSAARPRRHGADLRDHRRARDGAHRHPDLFLRAGRCLGARRPTHALAVPSASGNSGSHEG